MRLPIGQSELNRLILAAVAEGATELDLAGRDIMALPPEIGRLVRLRTLVIERNQLTALPPEIGQLAALRELWSSSNQLTALPREIGQLARLQVLRLDHNQLTVLPPEIGQLAWLLELELDNNPLVSPPPEIVQKGRDAVMAYLRTQAKTPGTAKILKKAPIARPAAQPEAPMKPAAQAFDVFLCHNSEEKEEVRKLDKRLRRMKIKPWFDERELIPGLPWQKALEAQINDIGSVAVIVGNSGIGPWHRFELDAYIRRFIHRRLPVIPVILASSTPTPELPVFLEQFHWVDFRKARPDPLKQLIRGIQAGRSSD